MVIRILTSDPVTCEPAGVRSLEEQQRLHILPGHDLQYVSSRGSVLVTFDLWFHRRVTAQQVQQELEAGFQSPASMVIDSSSIQITEREEEITAVPTPTPGSSSTTAESCCPPAQRRCGDLPLCLPEVWFCDGLQNCPNGFDEDLCATTCDGQFLLTGPTGSFHSEPYNSSTQCRWVIRVEKCFSIEISFQSFDTEEETDTLSLYEGVGTEKRLVSVLSGSTPPGSVWLFSDQSTVEFISDEYNNLPGFRAVYKAANTSNLSNEQKLSCSFEQGMCYWRQSPADSNTWTRTSGPTFPPFTGPSSDHTLGNSSGYYLVTPRSPSQLESSFYIYSLPLTPPPQPICLKFWYHMFGEDVYGLRVRLSELSSSQPNMTSTSAIVFQRDGNYGDNWNPGQVTLNLTTETMVVFEALKRGGMRNDIALDDIILTPTPCGEAPPEPSTVPPPTTPPTTPVDCGGPFDIWEPNSTFSSPNFPQNYGNKANCLWTLHAREGWNIRLHFLYFDLEATFDLVEVRDGSGPDSLLLGTERPSPDLISTANQVTVRLLTDSGRTAGGFQAHFTSGLNIGSPEPCEEGQYQCLLGDCIHGNALCDGVVDCPDASDEGDCVHMPVFNTMKRLQIQNQHSNYTVCARDWSQHLSDFTCSYLGHRSGKAVPVPAVIQDSPFVSITIKPNKTLELNMSVWCSSRLHDNPFQTDGHPYSGPMDQSSVLSLSPLLASVRVVGGVNAEKGAWPWIVSLHWRQRHVCGATLIDPHWLVTAAHCVYGKNLHVKLWTAVLGLHAQGDLRSPDVQTRAVDQILINNHYNRLTKQADIAMMHLEAPVNLTINQTRAVDQILINNHYNRLTKQADIAMMHLEAPVNLTINQTRAVDQILINNHYNRLTKQADIAMMHLEAPVNLTINQTRAVDQILINNHYNRLTKQADIAMMHLEAPVNLTINQTRAVDQILINNHYNRLTKQADIAMMHLEAPVNLTINQTRAVDQILINNHYNRLTKQADIAMMHLEAPVNLTINQTRAVDQILINNHYNRLTKQADIAMMHLEAPVNLTSSPVDVLQEAQVPLVDRKQCQQQLPEYDITSSMLCAGFPAGGVDSCQVIKTILG
ncbi:Enteropeptidase [Merluccius polli]|uniref:Enteropeptidase n=1 Tax=Merluccius polli TaxID=89951 RepID=A0AA47P514_MERPO|nr:Enteropeptidase [Merluccius polli]